jgi:hypothetical protein
MASRGNKVAFSAYPELAKGGANFAEPLHAGQIDLETGKLDWLFPLGTTFDDYYMTYDMAMAPNGDVIFAAHGYGTTLVGAGGYQFDGFVAVFDTFGTKRFAKRLEIWDEPPPIDNRPQFVSATIIADDDIRICTGFYVTPPGQPTFTAFHIFSFTPEGTQTYRLEVPQVPNTYQIYAYPVIDDSMWVYHPPGPPYRYSKGGDVLDTLEVPPPPDADFRGFSPIKSTSGLINFTTKGITNELYRFDVELPLVPLFNEPVFPQFQAGQIRQTLGFDKTYFIEMGYNGSSYRFATIDAQGNRGSATTLEKITGRFVLLDNGSGVFFRVTDIGTEFIVQPL